MNSYVAHIVVDPGIAGIAAGDLLPITSFERYGMMPGQPIVAYTVAAGGASIRLAARFVEMLEPAAAKRLRVARKRDANRAAPTWRGPGRS